MPRPGPTGRPHGCTPDVIKKIAEAVGAGNAIEVAAVYAGISPATFYNWQARGKAEQQKRARSGYSPNADEAIFLEFLETIQKAEADAEVRNVAIIQQAARKSWQAAAWFSERKHHDRWGRKDRQQQEQSGELTLRIVYGNPDPNTP